MHNKLEKIISKAHLAYQVIRSTFILCFIIFILIGVSKLDQIKQIFTEAKPEPLPANFVIDCSESLGVINKNWQNLSQGGEYQDWSLKPIHSKVAALKPKYIRIDHIYDYYEIVKNDNGSYRFDFSKLDKILDEIISVGAKPYLSLSYMPPAIAQDGILSKPVDWNLWQLTVQKTIEYVSGTKGIANVYYEIWNEPDLFGNWKIHGSKNYKDLYYYASQGASKAKKVLNFKIGGPATTALYKNWLNGLIDLKLKNQIRLDFFSWHKYALDPYEYQVDIASLQKWMDLADFDADALEYHITEWGPDSEVNSIYDNKISAMHFMSVAIVLEDFIDKSFVFEIQDGPEGNFFGVDGGF